MIEPQVSPAIEVRQRTVATEISAVDLRLGEIVRQIAEANGYDSQETINVLERNGLPTALEFVQPLLEILKRDSASPLRRLTALQMSCLYVDNARRQAIILDELEAQMESGRQVVFQTGMWKALWASYRAKVAAAKHREGVTPNRTRDDYQKEVAELRERVSLYENALEKVAAEVGLEVNDFISQIIQR